MKSLRLVKLMWMSAVFGLCLVSVAEAGPRERERERKSRLLDQNEQERVVMVTGSHLPQKVKRKSIGTTTPYNIRIYSQRELESTGRSTPGEALRALDPSITISGR
ncbi:MAG: hypothetical protein M3Y69_05855 [Verrucomicrobiota bacterium]|nr:hypothetical protein [Verrucomicrobiota bacterium]